MLIRNMHENWKSLPRIRNEVYLSLAEPASYNPPHHAADPGHATGWISNPRPAGCGRDG